MSKLLKSIHSSVHGMHKAGVVDKTTMREFDELCLPKIVEFRPQLITEIREKNEVSQSVFAKYLNISLSTVRQWEQGTKTPSGASLKLLSLINEKGLDILV